ncbi:MAG: flagellar basal body rod protein FlgF [Salinisphaera sp.]|jgi:flagellar basal-body rod protein FlgF|nr:flagellar basal body rod protein FlgF [Salinisphaera sp.]
MDRMIYTALSGANQILQRQAVVANDLANASTVGFKGQLSMFRAVPVNGAGLPTRTITAQTTPEADMSDGQIMHTGRALDVAVQGKGWLAVQGSDGQEAYTRAGDLQTDSTGVLRSGRFPVLGNDGQPIVLPLNAKVAIAHDGTISALGAGNDPKTLSAVAQLKLVDGSASNMIRGDDGLFRARPGAGGSSAPLPADDTVRVSSGALESSNVSPTATMVSMIDDARQFEMQMKMLSSADENARSANQLLSLK